MLHACDLYLCPTALQLAKFGSSYQGPSLKKFGIFFKVCISRVGVNEPKALNSTYALIIHLISLCGQHDHDPQFGCPGAAHDAFMAWRALPGWAATTEAFQRGTSHALSADEVMNAAQLAADTQLLHLLSSNIPALCECFSLAATVRKLLWPYLQPGAKNSKTASQEPQQQLLHTPSEELDSHRVSDLFENMLNIFLKLGAEIARSSCCDGNCDGSGRSSNSVGQLQAVTIVTLLQILLRVRKTK